nr:MAG TPA: hypothetical protein [Caudoviricetes sp.]
MQTCAPRSPRPWGFLSAESKTLYFFEVVLSAT